VLVLVLAAALVDVAEAGGDRQASQQAPRR
jgi:hypothetical protein